MTPVARACSSSTDEANRIIHRWVCVQRIAIKNWKTDNKKYIINLKILPLLNFYCGHCFCWFYYYCYFSRTTLSLMSFNFLMDLFIAEVMATDECAIWEPWKNFMTMKYNATDTVISFTKNSKYFPSFFFRWSGEICECRNAVWSVWKGVRQLLHKHFNQFVLRMFMISQRWLEHRCSSE